MTQHSKTLFRAGKVLAALALGLATATVARADDKVILKVAHFLPATSSAQINLIQPWCDKIAQESNQRMVCQIYPAMQLGGTPAQLFDQAKDGVADIIWTVPTYAAGRFVKSEVFELPWIAVKAEAGSGIWLCGGGALAAQLAGEIDRLVLKVHPVLFGDGIPLFGRSGYAPEAFTRTASTAFDSGVTLLEFRRSSSVRLRTPTPASRDR